MALLWCVLLAQGCSSDGAEPNPGSATQPGAQSGGAQPAGTQSLYASFRVVVPGVAEDGAARPVGTRAAAEYGPGVSWGDDYEQSGAVGFENRLIVDESHFHVALYDAVEGSYMGRFKDIVRTNLSMLGPDYLYEFHAKLDIPDQSISLDELNRMTLKMVVVANMGDVSDDMLAAGLSSDAGGLGTLEYDRGQVDGDDPAIPMWGVATVEIEKVRVLVDGEPRYGFVPSLTSDMGKVDLLRALAKVEVRVNLNGEGPAERVIVERVTVNRANTTGYGLPGEWNTVGDTKRLTFGNTLRVPADVQSETDRTFRKANDTDGVVFYLPECENSSADEIKMTVCYSVEGEERTGEIHLCSYADGKPESGYETKLWNVVRNHHYLYTITGIGKIGFSATVCNWDGVEEIEVDMTK